MTGTPAIDRALHDIDELENDGDITDEMAQRARDAVGLLFDADTVYASIAPDGDDLTFYWVGGDRAIEIDLYANGANGHGWYCVRRGDDRRIEEGGTPRWMRDALAQFSEAVEAANPAWREQTR